MPRVNWGSQQDLSGLFGGLAQQYENRIEDETQRALKRSQADQDAKDADVYSKWKNGEISDEEWLDYIRQRIEESRGDPAEFEKWNDTLREHAGAIADAQIETQFSLGKVTLGALLAHYQKRMKGIEQNSPAYRDLAQRYAQLSDAAGQVGGSYRSGRGGGGGRSSSGGSSSGGSRAVQPPSTTASGFDLNGPDVITPTTDLTGVDDADDYINDLDADKNRFKSIYTFIKNNPDATTFTDARTGETFPLDKDTLLALDKQNIRNNNLRAAFYFSKGDDKKGTAALDDNTYFMSTTLPEHNTMMSADMRREFQQHVVDQLVAASSNPNPQDRMDQYAKLAKAAGEFNKNIYTDTQVVGKTKVLKGADTEGVQGMQTVTATRSKTVEEMPDEETRAQDFGLQRALEIVSDPTLSDEQISSELNQIFEQTPNIGLGGTKMSFESLLEGPSGDSGTNDLPEGYVGPLQNRTQLMGLMNADNPEYQGPKYVFAMEDGQPKVVAAQVHVNHQAGGLAVPTLVPAGADPDTTVMTRQRIGGQDVTVWAAVEPIDDPQYSVYRLQKPQTIDGRKFDAGQLVPSSVIAKLGMAGIRTLERNGSVARESTVEGVQMPDGSFWYRDPEGGLFTPGKLSATTNSDSITGGLYVGDDGQAASPNFKPFSDGVIVPYSGGISQREMQGWVEQEMMNGRINPDDYHARDAGGQLDQGPINFGEMYLPTVQRQAQDRARAASAMSKVKADAETLEAQKEQARQERAQQWARTELTATERNRWRKLGVDPVTFAADRLREFGSELGLNLSPTINNDFPTAKMRKDKALAVLDNPRGDAMMARAKRQELETQRAAEPRFAPLPVQRVEGTDLLEKMPAMKPVYTPPVVEPAPLPTKPKRNLVQGADIAPVKPKAPAPKTGTAPDYRQKRSSSSSNRRGGFKES